MEKDKSKLYEEIRQLEERIAKLQYELMQKRSELYSQTPTTYTTETNIHRFFFDGGRFA